MISYYLQLFAASYRSVVFEYDKRKRVRKRSKGETRGVQNAGKRSFRFNRNRAKFIFKSRNT